jgi:cyclophilin family peptidyl-prolyl cis-trans isomerase
MKKAYLTLQHGVRPLGTLHLELYDTDCPRTVQNFVGLLERHYRGSNFHRIIPGFIAQGGDFENGDGTGGYSVLNGGSPNFADENFLHSHRSAGMLSMANSGPDTNGSQFFITFRPTPHLDGKHVVFGHVNLQSSANVLEQLERIPTDSKNNCPRLPATIVDCGVTDQDSRECERENQAVNEQEDENEIDLEQEEQAQDDEEHSGENHSINSDQDESQQSHEHAPKTKAEMMKLRLRKLKQKMNQARQLNKQAVREEGEKIVFSSATGGGTSSSSLLKSSLKHTAIDKPSSGNMDPKISKETALESLTKARRRSEQTEINQYAVNDYHNPEGQYRNYERNLKSLHSVTTAHSEPNKDSMEIYNPLDHRHNKKDEERQRQGAHRIATELNRRIEKAQKKDRKRLAQEASESDMASAADGINKRNKRFNEKISRNYDKQTAEIRHNLERGTAL